MDSKPSDQKSQRVLSICPFYYGWFVVGLSFLTNLTAAGIRSAPSVLIHPLEAEFGWSRTEIASAASLNLLLLGLFASVGGWVRVHFGNYQYAFLAGGCMGLIAACLALTIDRRNVENQEMPIATEFAGA